MSFFELDGGKAKPKTKKSTKPKPKATKAKKASPGKKKAKKGGNFLGTVSELFAPAGWESFVTAAGLLALDRTDNFLRKGKDSKKQRGGADEDGIYSNDALTDENENFTSRMTGGARKRRTQRGGSDGHLSLTEHYHSLKEHDNSADGEGIEDNYQTDQMDQQTGGAKKKTKSKKKVVKKVNGRKHRGGAMSEEQQNALYQAYVSSPSPNKNKNSQNANAYDTFITGLLTQLGVEVNDTNKQEAKLVIDYKKKSALPNGNQSKVNAKSRLNAFYTSQPPPPAPAQNRNLLFGNNLLAANSSQPIPIPGTNGRPNSMVVSTAANNSVPSAQSATSAPSVSNNELPFPMSPAASTTEQSANSANFMAIGGGKKAKPKSKAKSKLKSKAKPKTNKAPKRK